MKAKRKKLIRVYNAEITWQSIVDSFTIEPDNDCGAPWDDCDGWDHELIPFSWRNIRDDEIKHRHDVLRSDGRWYRIELGECYLPDYAYYHAKGCSKQVSRELAAQAKRRCIDQLKSWYRDGWQWFYVYSDFCAPDGKEYHESCGGIDSEEYARDEMIPELASNLASELERDGWIVTNQPDREAKRKASKIESRKYHLAYNLSFANLAGRS